MSVVALAAGPVWEHVVAPTLFVFVLFVAMLVAVGLTWPWPGKAPDPGPSSNPPMSALAKHLLATALGGYAIFLVIVTLFHVVIGGGPASVIADAASGGAFLGFVIAVPVLVALAAIIRRR